MRERNAPSAFFLLRASSHILFDFRHDRGCCYPTLLTLCAFKDHPAELVKSILIRGIREKPAPKAMPCYVLPVTHHWILGTIGAAVVFFSRLGGALCAGAAGRDGSKSTGVMTAWSCSCWLQPWRPPTSRPPEHTAFWCKRVESRLSSLAWVHSGQDWPTEAAL
jgi:hypothetical protein